MPALKIDDAYATLTSTDGEVIELSRSEYDDVRTRLRLIQGGKRDDAPNPLLTTSQAANILGVSRRTFTRMLDRGDIPCVRYGHGHRRVRLLDVLAYQREERDRRHEALEEISWAFEKAGMYEDFDAVESYLEQFK